MTIRVLSKVNRRTSVRSRTAARRRKVEWQRMRTLRCGREFRVQKIRAIERPDDSLEINATIIAKRAILVKG